MDIKFKVSEKSLFDAVRFSIRSEIQRIIKTGVNINAKDNDGWTPLMIAADKGDVETVRLLIELGADVNLLNSDGETALMLTAFCNNIKTSKLLVSKGADITIKDKIGRTAYDIAYELFPRQNHDYLRIQESKPETKIDVNNILQKNQEYKDINKETKIRERTIKKTEAQWSNVNKSMDNNTNNNVSEVKQKLFFELIFFSKGGTVINLYDIEKRYKNQFHKDFNVILLYKFISYYNDLHNTDGGGDGKAIKELTPEDYILLPSVKEKERFFIECFCINEKLTVIRLENIQKLYKEKFNFELDGDDLSNFINKHDDIKSRIRKLEDGDFEIQHEVKFAISQSQHELIKRNIRDNISNKTFSNYIYPTKERIKQFLSDYFLNLEINSCVYYKTLLEAFKRKFNAEIQQPIIQVFIKQFNSQHEDLEIKEIDIGEYRISYPIELIENYIFSIFTNKQIGTKISLSEIKDAIKEEFNIDYEDNQITEILSNKTIIETYRNEQNELLFFRIPSKEDIYSFLVEYFEENSGEIFVFSFKEMNDRFYEKFNSYLILRDFTDWLSITSNNSFPQYIIEMLPYDIFIRRPIINNPEPIFSVCIPYRISKKHLSFLLQYEKEINEYLNANGLILRPLIQNKDEYIITFKETSSLEIDNSSIAKQIQEIFLEENVGFELPVQKINDTYDINFEDGVYEFVVDILNVNYVDLNIIYDKSSKMLKSEFKKTSLFDFNINDNEIECPVCGLKINIEKFKFHYLDLHVSRYYTRSILVFTYTNDYYCHHCNRSGLMLYDALPFAIIRHLTGGCKKESFYNSKSSNKTFANSKSERIWQGSAYANDSMFLGNTGHLYRENGRFGSYPEEDSFD